MRTMDECLQPGSSIPIGTVINQTDNLVMEVIEALEGDEESTVVHHLMKLRHSLARQEGGRKMTAEVEAARAGMKNLVNKFFYEKLMALPEIKIYLDEFGAGKNKE